MIEGPIKQDLEYLEVATGQVYTVLAANTDGATETETVLEVLGVTIPAVVYYNQHKIERTNICAETAFRERFIPHHHGE